MNLLDHAFNKTLNDGEKAFVPYVMAGDGGLDSLKDKLVYLQSLGATAIEVGVPFSDPVADGPIIQDAGKRALLEGTSLKDILKRIKSLRSDITVPIILMTYLNPVYQFGIEKFSKEAAKSGISGLIVPDLPFEHSELLSQHLKENKIALIQLVTTMTPFDRLKKIVSISEGFVYAVTVTGITGVQNSFHKDVTSFLTKLKEISPIPVLAGFGISTNEQVRNIGSYCDGVVVGSKIVELFHQETRNEMKELISK